jgi:hypothetical protein
VYCIIRKLACRHHIFIVGSMPEEKHSLQTEIRKDMAEKATEAADVPERR